MTENPKTLRWLAAAFSAFSFVAPIFVASDLRDAPDQILPMLGPILVLLWGWGCALAAMRYARRGGPLDI